MCTGFILSSTVARAFADNHPNLANRSKLILIESLGSGLMARACVVCVSWLHYLKIHCLVFAQTDDPKVTRFDSTQSFHVLLLGLSSTDLVYELIFIYLKKAS